MMIALNLLCVFAILTYTKDVNTFVHKDDTNPELKMQNFYSPLQESEADQSTFRLENDSNLNLKDDFQFQYRRYENALKIIKSDLQSEQNKINQIIHLADLLKDPTKKVFPIVYFEDIPPVTDHTPPNIYIEKKTRYYRRYPWKRQNNHYRSYEADTRYLCVPSREDVFKLLVGLHENRNGDQQKTINFCNRKRPAKAIFTNIRFLG